jgi:CubicO group peptidase (beta-lactamase class C family)
MMDDAGAKAAGFWGGRRAVRREVLIGFGLLPLIGGRAEALPAIPESLADAARQLAISQDVPALGFGLVRHGHVAGVTTIGFADRDARTPVTPDTAFLVSSISKVVTGTVLMQLAEGGRFHLDDPIGPWLDFPVANPSHPGAISFRQLMTHTSSISDRGYDGFEVQGDPKTSLREFLVGYLTPRGRWYSPEKCYLDIAPGAQWSYSNVGSALVGYLAERIARRPLKAQSAERLFRPLGMSPAAWSLADLGRAPAATPYVGANGHLRPIAPVGYPDWPAGLLRASTHAMTRFLAACAGGGRLEGRQIMRASTLQEMIELKPYPLPNGQTRLQGLFWEALPGEGIRLIAKSGSDPGSMNYIAFDPASGNGAVVLTNHSRTPALADGLSRLIRQAVTI